MIHSKNAFLWLKPLTQEETEQAEIGGTGSSLYNQDVIGIISNAIYYNNISVNNLGPCVSSPPHAAAPG